MQRIRVEPGWYLLLALWLLVVPLPWLLAALMAAGFHELCHAGMILLLGGTIYEVRIGPSGAVMDTELWGPGRELLAAAAGPAGSFCCLAVKNVCPELAICGFVQGIFNLLPMYPMDGGRMLGCTLELWLPKLSTKTRKGIENGAQWASVTLLCGLLLRVLPLHSAAFLTGMALLRTIGRKTPCKPGQIRVQ